MYFLLTCGLYNDVSVVDIFRVKPSLFVNDYVVHFFSSKKTVGRIVYVFIFVYCIYLLCKLLLACLKGVRVNGNPQRHDCALSWRNTCDQRCVNGIRNEA